MGVDIQVLVRQVDLDLVRSRLEGLLRVHFEKDSSRNPKGVWMWKGVGVDLAVFNVEFEDDNDIAYSRYGVEISISGLLRSPHHPYHRDLQRSLGLLIGEHLARRQGWECLVLEDFEIVLNTFGADTDR